MGPEINSICVFCGSSQGNSSELADFAFDLGTQLAKNNITLIYGGASIGLMGRVADGALAAGGKVIGVIPTYLKTKEIAHHTLTELIETKDMHQRKLEMYQRSDGFIALPGGIGTLEEFFEIFTWRQLGRHDKPIVLANINNFYQRLYEMLEHVYEKGFLKKDHFELFEISQNMDELLAHFLK